MGDDKMYNAVIVDEQTLTAGQPTEDQLRSAAADGYANVINLATLDPGKALPDEAGLVRSLGMAYFHIPVVWSNPQLSDFAAFESVMTQLPAGKTLIHCAANFRVTAFYSLYAQKHLGWTEERADDFWALIWTGSNNAVWEDFIERIKGQISS